MSPSTERWICGMLLAATFGLRAIHADQPIVENYVGRQIPTAMVARNLERGSGFLHPQLDTGPWPNLFLVEPPIYAQVVARAHQVVGFDWEICGRLTSALATALGGWGLFGLVRRREGALAGLLALGSFCLFPVMIRYGRAFQPDALMLGSVLVGLRGWDEFDATGRVGWMILGGFVLAVGLAIKVTSAWALLPYWLLAKRLPIPARMALAVAMLGPALAWYVHAWASIREVGGGSMASGDNASLWLGSIGPAGWVRLATWAPIARNLVGSAFTPVGFAAGLAGLALLGRLDPLWKAWAAGCGSSLLWLAPKWHHGYYWMAFAPLAAVGVARSLASLASRGRRGVAGAAGLGFVSLICAGGQSASTWATPAGWRVLDDPAGRRQLAAIGRASTCAAPEALLYYLDGDGFRLEFEPDAARRAAGEWGGTLGDPARPLALAEFYESKWASLRPDGTVKLGRATGLRPRDGTNTLLVVADAGYVRPGGPRDAWRRAVRVRPGTRILIDRLDLFVAKLIPDTHQPEGRP